ncbi:IS3 family transposase [Paucibacter sp. O1-1]|nr:IS3 family transposase [Paucibacter sp. O1-1]MCU7373246.1 IS3 family transposase [Paucibacter sp. O1-1]MDA3826486.1 IS3 family transposase [Paucibacter sp. O1-1]MDA3828245.1 IS3 family transposase [Paucibacter sp. O1-1]
MTKYNESLKLEVVQEYLSGGMGSKSLAKKYGIGRTRIVRWVAGYRQHGIEGLRAKCSQYSAEFKLSVLREIERQELSHLQAAAMFDLRDAGAIARWLRQYHEGGLEALKPKPRGRPKKMPTPKPPKALPAQVDDASALEALRKENEYLRAEVAYLKKPRGLGSREAASCAERAQAVLELRPEHALATLLKVAGLSRSTFYYQVKALGACDKYASLKASIQAIYKRHKGRYGYRRVTGELRQAGQVVNHKTVQRLMGCLGLKSLVRPKKYRSYRGEYASAPNLLDRQFEAARPNEKWVTDVTEFNVRGEKLYLSPVMDLYNGEIIAYEMQERPMYSLVGSMLKKALAKLKGQDKAPLLHSDQGWQYQMADYRKRLARHGLTQSMSRKGNCLDNAAMESFFGTLKSEFFYLNKFTSIDELREGIRRYIRYYNHERIKLKLKGLSPVQYRTQALGH